jgi:hypothetical protein
MTTDPTAITTPPQQRRRTPSLPPSTGWWIAGFAVALGAAFAVVASVASASPAKSQYSADSAITLCADSSGAVSYQHSGKCPKHDTTLSVGSQHEVKKLKSQVKSLKSEVSTLKATLHGVTRIKSHGMNTLQIAGENVQIVNGTGDETTTDGLGNLIIGYDDNPDGLERTGSHDLVLGDDNGFTSYGGLVAGYGNLIAGEYSSVTGGFGNTTTGKWSAVGGGTDNTAGGKWTTIAGGATNTATGDEATVDGGMLNTASGNGAGILGGYDGTVATSDCSTIPSNPGTSSQCK